MHKPTTAIRIAGPLDPFKAPEPGTFLGGWRNAEARLLAGGTSTDMAQDALNKGYITEPGTYALVLRNALFSVEQVALVTIAEGEPVKPPLKVVRI